MRNLFIAVGLLTAVVGILWLTIPSMMLGAFGTEVPDDITLYMSQRAGALLLGICITFSLASRTTASAFRTALLSGGAFTFGLLFILSGVGFFTSVVGPFIWFVGLVELIVSISFLYFLFRRTKLA